MKASWYPKDDVLKNSNIYQMMLSNNFENYEEFWRWSVSEKESFWAGIKKQCISLGYDMKNLESDVAYDDNTKEGREFARQCDGGYCGN